MKKRILKIFFTVIKCPKFILMKNSRTLESISITRATVIPKDNSPPADWLPARPSAEREPACGVGEGAVLRVVARNVQLRQLDVRIHDQRIRLVPFEYQVVRCVRHCGIKCEKCKLRQELFMPILCTRFRVSCNAFRFKRKCIAEHCKLNDTFIRTYILSIHVCMCAHTHSHFLSFLFQVMRLDLDCWYP